MIIAVTISDIKPVVYTYIIIKVATYWRILSTKKKMNFETKNFFDDYNAWSNLNYIVSV